MPLLLVSVMVKGDPSPLLKVFHGDWAGKLYVTSATNERLTSGISFEADNSPNYSSTSPDAWFGTPTATMFHDSIGYSWYGNPPSNTLFPNGGLAAFGNPPFSPRILSLNNLHSSSNIFLTVGFFGGFNEALTQTTDSSIYTIYNGRNEIITSDSMGNFPSDGINVAPGKYTDQVVTHDYFIRGVRGEARLSCTFDLRNPDPNPPRLPVIQILNSKSLCVDSLSPHEKGSLILSFDRIATFIEFLSGSTVLASQTVPLPNDSIDVFYRVHGDSNWLSIPMTRSGHDTSGELSYFGDLSPTSQLDSAAIDLKIDVEDQSGNTSEWVMDPAYCVGDYGRPTAIVNSAGASSVPKVFAFYQNYPNPFNPTTTITYDLPKVVHVALEIYNMLGQHVETLVDAMEPASHHDATFDGSRLASGVYFYRLDAGGNVLVKKLLLLK